MYRKKFLGLLLLIVFAPLTACSDFGANENYLSKAENFYEISNTLPGYAPDSTMMEHTRFYPPIIILPMRMERLCWRLSCAESR